MQTIFLYDQTSKEAPLFIEFRCSGNITDVIMSTVCTLRISKSSRFSQVLHAPLVRHLLHSFLISYPAVALLLETIGPKGYTRSICHTVNTTISC